jgi:hypothetical protein
MKGETCTFISIGRKLEKGKRNRSSNMYIFRIWRFCDGDYEECRLLACRSYVTQCFGGKYPRASSMSRWLGDLSRFSCPEDGGDSFLRNFGSHKIYTTSHPRRQHSCMFNTFRLKLRTHLLIHDERATALLEPWIQASLQSGRQHCPTPLSQEARLG